MTRIDGVGEVIAEWTVNSKVDTEQWSIRTKIRDKTILIDERIDIGTVKTIELNGTWNGESVTYLSMKCKTNTTLTINGHSILCDEKALIVIRGRPMSVGIQGSATLVYSS